MVPPGNHPYAAFSEDSPWQITYDGVLYLEQILRCPTRGSSLTNYGLFIDLPVHLPEDRSYTSGCCFWESRTASATREPLLCTRWCGT